MAVAVKVEPEGVKFEVTVAIELESEVVGVTDGGGSDDGNDSVGGGGTICNAI